MGTRLGFERLLFFSDAVFAIAITLLVLELRLPEMHGGRLDLGPLVPKLVGFAISFGVISLYWLAHHRLFETIIGHDRRLLFANLCFLAGIAFLPFPTTIIAEYRGIQWAVLFYALAVTAVGVLLLLLTLVARRPRFMAPGETRGGTWHLVIRTLGAPLVFVASAFVAEHDPALAMLLWSALVVTIPLAEALGRAAERRIDATPA